MQALEQTGATGVLIAANGVPSVELNSLVRTLHAMGVHVHLSSGLTRIGHRRVRQLPMAHEPFFYLEPASPRRLALAVKRVVDVVVASFVLVLTSPVLLVSALAVKLSDGGPVFFHQVRIGQDGRRITIRKIRSMTVDAEDQLDELRDLNERTGPLFKLDDDPRITRVGHWLRVSSIDELPQLLNVLDGSLSLIGPRPALPEEVAQFDDEMLGRLRMRPGVTGLWQVEARHNPSYFAYRHLDLFYVENWSLGLDVTILVATARTVRGRCACARCVAPRRPPTSRRSTWRRATSPRLRPADRAVVDAAGRLVLVANAGGHLTQLFRLAPRLPSFDAPPVWVTSETAQSRSILEGQDVVWVPEVAPRDVGNMMRCLPQARALARQRPAMAVSTGSGVALGFLPVLAMSGVPCHYVESATRVEGPSLTGRLLRWSPGVRTYSQHRHWSDDRWRYPGSVFEGFESASREPAPSAIRRAVVTVGTLEYPFERMVRKVAAHPAGRRRRGLAGRPGAGRRPGHRRSAVGAVRRAGRRHRPGRPGDRPCRDGERAGRLRGRPLPGADPAGAGAR